MLASERTGVASPDAFVRDGDVHVAGKSTCGSVAVGGATSSIAASSSTVCARSLPSVSARWYLAHDSDVCGVGFVASRSSGFCTLLSVERIFSATADEYALRAAASRFEPVSKRDGRGLRSMRSSRVSI